MGEGIAKHMSSNILLLSLLGQEGQMQRFAFTDMTHTRLVQKLNLVQHVTQMGNMFLTIVIGDDTVALETANARR
jgi:hypothetical protein